MAGDAHSSSNEHAMFVNDIQFVKPPQIKPYAFVWFDLIEKFYSLFPNSLYFSRRSGFVLRGVFKDRKHGLGIWRVSFGEHKLPNQMVKRTSEVVDCVSCDARNLGNYGSDSGDIVTALSGLRVVLGHDFIGITLKEGVDGKIQLLDVLSGPF